MFLINAIYETFFKSRQEKEAELRKKASNITVFNITIDNTDNIDTEKFFKEAELLRNKARAY